MHLYDLPHNGMVKNGCVKKIKNRKDLQNIFKSTQPIET